jgi:hypothetical protein
MGEQKERTMESNDERRLKLAADLRKFADWLDETPEVLLDSWSTGVWVNFYGATRQDVLALARTSGKFRKDYSGNHMQLIKEIGYVTYTMSLPRDEICTSRVIGTRTRTVRDPEGYKNIPMVEVEEDIVEWDCHPLLQDSEDV